ncbi:MAG: AraC family transcriptional regulator [Eubacterium sp.]|nr:AraC family transcriptional regulator [Eubacterium sp.]
MQALLVDDEAIAVNALKRRVNWEKYGVGQVFTAYSMQQAQEVFQREIVDFMLCDIEMPQGNGLELFEWVKVYYPAVECIYVTCHPEYEYIRKALRLGSADYILKPIDYEELDEILLQLAERVGRKRNVEKIPAEILRELEKETGKKQDDAVYLAKRFILEHIQENIYVEEIAEQVHFSTQYLMRLFKKETDMSILEFITTERIRLAKELLEKTEFPVNKVADSVGYGNYSYFTKIFKKYEKVSPRTYRQKYRKKA